jgi:hypothetical protein
MSDLDVLLDERKFVRTALTTIDKKEFEIMNYQEKVDLLVDINKTRHKVLNYLGYERRESEKGIWYIAKQTKPEQKEIEEYDRFLDEYYKNMEKD